MTLNPHAPAANSTTRRLLGRFYFTSVFWYRFPYWAFSHLPEWTERVSVVFFSTFFFLVLGSTRRAIASNLQPVLGKANVFRRWLRAYRTLVTFSASLAERYRFRSRPERFRFIVEGEEHWNRAMESGRGVVLVTAHVGFWEIAPQFGASAGKRRIHIVREKEIDPRAQKLMREMVARGSDQCITHFAGDDPGLTLKLAEALKEGDIVAFQADRPRAGGRTVLTTLFGQPMPLPVGPAALARSAGVPLVPVFNYREDHYLLRGVVRAPIEIAHTDDREADLAAAIHRVAAEIEWAIRQQPHQWFCFRKLWGHSRQSGA